MSSKKNIIDIINKQENKGIDKYGVTVDDNNLEPIEWINHLQEELVDALFYLEQIKSREQQMSKNK